jgi:hypothetical protein
MTTLWVRFPKPPTHLAAIHYASFKEMTVNHSPMVLSVVEDLVHNLVAKSYERLGRQKLQIDGRHLLTL